MMNLTSLLLLCCWSPSPWTSTQDPKPTLPPAVAGAEGYTEGFGRATNYRTALAQALEDAVGKAKGIAVKKGLFPWTASGRAIANGRDEGFTKLLFDAETHRILGGGIVGTHAGDMIGEVALAIEMGADEVDIGKTIHPHPTLGESIGMAAEVAHGSCTDLPPAKR
jgi:hypothetical protein